MRLHRMSVLRLPVLLIASLALASCGTAARMLNSFGRALHLHAETTEPPGRFRLEAHDVRQSLAAGEKIDVKPQATAAGLAQR